MRTLLRPWLAASLVALLAPPLARAGEPAPPGAPPAADGEDDAETRGYVGFSPVVAELLTAEQRKELGAASGFVVQGVTPGMPAQAAGLRVGDVILKVNGHPLPDTRSFTPESKKEVTDPFWAAWKAMTKDVKPGSEVVLVVRRGTAETTVKATAVDYDTRKRFEDAAAEEAAYPTVPDPAGAGAPRAASFDFEKVEDSRPPGFLAFDGMWEVRGEEGVPKENQILLQDSMVESWALCLATGPGLALADGKATVRWKPVSGREDASGGIVFRAKDRKNYYVARGNALEPNLRLYVVKDGDRRQLASADVKMPAIGAWHTLEVTFTGRELRAVLDGNESVKATDATFATGWTGLWTKADSVTQFDDFRVEPAAASAPR